MPERGGRRRRAPLVAGTTATRAEKVAARAPSVLVVDDDAAIRELLRVNLSLDGWTVTEASSGDEALELWPALQPDVVLLDQHMSGLSGLDCAAALRQQSENARIIMFTAHLDSATTEAARDLRILPMRKEDQGRLQDLMKVLAGQLRAAAVS